MENNKNITIYPAFINGKSNQNGLTMDKATLSEVYDLVARNEDVKAVVNKIRWLTVIGNTDKAQKVKNEESVCIVFQSEYNVSRKKSNVFKLTGLVCLDVDDVKSPQTIRDTVAKNTELNPVMAFVSPSGKGVKVVVKSKRLENMCGDWETLAEEFRVEYIKLSAYLWKRHGLVTDFSCKESARVCYSSHDAECYYNMDEPYTDIPDIGAENAEEICNKMWGNEEQQTTYRYDGYDKEQHAATVAAIISSLKRDENGNYVYTRNAKLHIGHRHLGNATTPVGGKYGYDAMLALYTAACAIFGGDIKRADAFLEESFEEYGKDGWQRVLPVHARTLPVTKVLCDMLEMLNFEGYEKTTRFTTIEEPKDVGTIEPTNRQYVSEISEEIDKKYGLPKILSHWFADSTLPKQHADIRFYSAITLLSGFAPNQRVQCSLGKKRGLNLQMFVVGRQSGGKGEMDVPYTELIAPHLDVWCDRLNEMEKRRVWDEKMAARGKSNKTTFSFDDEEAEEPEEAEEGATQQSQHKGEPLFFKNNIGKPTYASLMRILPANNAKCVMTTTEFSVWRNAEASGNACLLDTLKQSYDNSTLSNETAKDIDAGKRTSVYNPEFSVLASGTPAEYLKLFPSVEGGELRRGWTFLVQKDGEWTYFGSKPKKTTNDGVEEFFLGWYFYNFFAQYRYVYTLTDEDDAKAGEMFNEYVRKMHKTFGGNTEMEQAQEGLIGSVPVITFRVAALLQSLDEYERYVWPKMRIEDAGEYLNGYGLRVWSDTEGKVVEVPVTDYIDLARERANGRMALPEQPVYLLWKWVELAFWLVRERIGDGLNAIVSHDTKNMVSGVNDPTVGVMYVAALGLLGKTEFETSDYAKAYERVSGKKCASSNIANYLKKLLDLEKIEKSGRGIYKLKNSRKK